jgi:hypothetical protein
VGYSAEYENKNEERQNGRRRAAFVPQRGEDIETSYNEADENEQH